MFKLPKLQDLDVVGKKVLLRADLDIDIEDFENDLRIKSLIPTLDYLKEKSAQIIILAHKGRPLQNATDGKPVFDDKLSLKPFQPFFDNWGAEVKENLRFEKGEEENDPDFVKRLAGLGDIYINEAFASSHRSHASIIGIPKLLPHAMGLRFEKEIENLSKVFEPIRPLVFLISGIKEDKLQYIKEFEKFADRVLVGGRLPDFLGDRGLESVRNQNGKVIVGNLVMDKEDITLHTIDKFNKEINNAGMIVVSGPLGKYEDEGHRQGTESVFKAVAECSAYKIAGGGDTEAALNLLGLTNKFDWVSVGGGAMLEFLSKKTLPGIEALMN
jgi:phosphoglycerate kinase